MHTLSWRRVTFVCIASDNFFVRASVEHWGHNHLLSSRCWTMWPFLFQKSAWCWLLLWMHEMLVKTLHDLHLELSKLVPLAESQMSLKYKYLSTKFAMTNNRTSESGEKNISIASGGVAIWCQNCMMNQGICFYMVVSFEMQLDVAIWVSCSRGYDELGGVASDKPSIV